MIKHCWISISFILFFLFSCSITTLYSYNNYENYIRVRVYHEKDERFISEIKTNLAKSIVEFQMKIKSFPDIETIINIAPDEETFNNWLKSKRIVFENTQAFCDLEKSEIFVRNPKYLGDKRKLIQVLLHEYIHLFINYHWTDAPLWFHEGMAVYFSEGLNFNYVFNFMSTYAFHQNYLLKKYAYKYPENKADLIPFYFQSAFLIKKTLDESPNKLYNLFDHSGFNQRFSSSFLTAFNKTQEEFLFDFEKKIIRFFYFNLYFGFLSSLWIALPIVLIIARIRKKFKNKEILEKWELDLLKIEIEKTIKENITEQ